MKAQTSIGMEPFARGRVRGYFFNPDTGERTQPFDIHNILTYTASDTMAQLLAGQSSYVPAYIGFIYGSGAAPTITDPPSSRVHDWDSIAEELADVGVVGNVNIVPLAQTPSVTVDGDATIYAGNSTNFVAHSTSGVAGTYGFDVSGGTYAAALADGDYYYHALLLTKLVVGATTTYWPFARVSLKETTYKQKPAGMELALFWQVSFF